MRCDGCCRFAEENSIWSVHLLKEEKLYPKNAFHPAPNKKDSNFLCPFLCLENNKCKIYELRPFECRLYPFLLNRDEKSGKIFLAADEKCPFVERNLEKKEFREHIGYLLSLLNSRKILNTLKNNPQIVQSYQDVLNLKELELTL